MSICAYQNNLFVTLSLGSEVKMKNVKEGRSEAFSGEKGRGVSASPPKLPSNPRPRWIARFEDCGG